MKSTLLIMNKILILLFCYLTFSCASKPKTSPNIDISEGYKFVSFNIAGTTADIRHFYDEIKNNYQNKSKLSENQLLELKEIFTSFKWKQHSQKKITGIENSIELCDRNECNCFIFTRNIVIDISRKRECYLSPEQHSIILKLLEF